MSNLWGIVRPTICKQVTKFPTKVPKLAVGVSDLFISGKIIFFKFGELVLAMLT
jgi:hypothetical protein